MFNRSHADELVNRLREPHRFIQIIRGARQVGKTTMVTRVVKSSGMPCHFASADAPTLQSMEWIEQQWETARLLESGSGPAAAGGACEVFYWRDRNREVDFVVQAGNMLTAIEVKSGRTRDSLPGMAAFAKAFPSARKLLVGGNGIPVEEFLSKPVEHWIQR